MKKVEIQKRYKAICKQILSGQSLPEVGKEFGLTRERIRQVLMESNISYKKILKERREKLFQEHLKIVTKKADELGRIPKNKEVAKMISSPLTPFARILKAKGYSSPKRGVPKINDKVLLNHLKDLSTHLGRTPGINDIMQASSFSHSTYYSHFGSLVNAQKLAGLKPNKQGPNKHTHKFLHTYKKESKK